MDELVVGMADYGIADVPGQVLVTFALGSCIGLTAYDPVAAVGGLLHFMLPDSGIDPRRAQSNPCTFGDTGIPLLLSRLAERGARQRRLIVYAVGGAQMLGEEGAFEIGKRNYLALRRILWKAGIRLRGQAVGGEESRTVRLEIGSGRLWIQEGGGQRELAPPVTRGGGPQWHTTS